MSVEELKLLDQEWSEQFERIETVRMRVIWREEQRRPPRTKAALRKRSRKWKKYHRNHWQWIRYWQHRLGLRADESVSQKLADLRWEMKVLPYRRRRVYP